MLRNKKGMLLVLFSLLLSTNVNSYQEKGDTPPIERINIVGSKLSTPGVDPNLYAEWQQIQARQSDSRDSHTKVKTGSGTSNNEKEKEKCFIKAEGKFEQCIVDAEGEVEHKKLTCLEKEAFEDAPWITAGINKQDYLGNSQGCNKVANTNLTIEKKECIRDKTSDRLVCIENS